MLTVHLFGVVEFRRGPQEAPIALRRSTGAVAAYLAASGRPQTRQALADLFCAEARDPMQALRSILSRIRQRLGSACLLSEPQTVTFNTSLAWIDCLAFAHALEQDLNALPLARLAQALDLYRGDFLAGTQATGSVEYEQWRLSERTRYQRLRARGLEALIERLIGADEFEAAIPRAQTLAQADPLVEEAQARLIWLYARSGQRDAALAQYERCRGLLEKELAVAPGPELRALRDMIVAGELQAAPRRRTTPAAAAQAPRVRGDFVGRAQELEQLNAAWSSAGAGACVVVGVTAEAGMGKTRLVGEFAGGLAKTRVAAGECYESTRSLPYGPWLELIERQLAQIEPAALKALSPQAAEHLSRLSPAAARRLKARSTAGGRAGSGALGHLLAAAAELLLELPGGQAQVVFVDNLQWADEASLQLFGFLARRAPPRRVMLIGAWRTEEAAEAPALRTLIGELQGASMVSVSLRPLTARAVGELVELLWPALPPGFRPHVRDLLVKATGGNPLLASEILRELAAAGAAAVPEALPVPRSVQDLIQRRLGWLPRESVQVVEAMAVLGTPATIDAAQATSGRSEDETSLALDLGERRGLLKPLDGDGPTHYDFSHDLMRAAVLAQLTPARSQVLHRRAARLLERAGAPAAALAQHWAKAGDRHKEGQYAAAAGEEAAAVYANQEAIAYLTRAIELTQDPARRARLRLRLGETQVVSGGWDEAEAAFTTALGEAADPTAQAQLQSALGRLMSRRGRYQEALGWLERARETWAAAGDAAGLAASVGTLGIVYWQLDDYDRALACYQEALRIETERGDQRGIAVWTGNIGGVLLQQGDYAQALEFHERSLGLREALGMKREAAIELGNIGNVHFEQHDYPRALDYHLQALRARQALDDRPGVATVMGYLGLDYYHLGAGATALACLRSGAQAQLRLGNREGLAAQLIRLGTVLTGLGEARAALGCLEAALDILDEIGAPFYRSEALSAKARALLELGAHAEAWALVEEAEQTAAELAQPVSVERQSMKARLAVALGRLTPREARAGLRALLETDRPAWERAALAYEAWRLRPEAAMAQQDAAEARALYAALYGRSQDPRDGQRWAEVGGEPEAAARQLPVPPLELAEEPPALEDLLTEVRGALAKWRG